MHSPGDKRANAATTTRDATPGTTRAKTAAGSPAAATAGAAATAFKPTTLDTTAAAFNATPTTSAAGCETAGALAPPTRCHPPRCAPATGEPRCPSAGHAPTQPPPPRMETRTTVLYPAAAHLERTSLLCLSPVLRSPLPALCMGRPLASHGLFPGHYVRHGNDHRLGQRQLLL